MYLLSSGDNIRADALKNVCNSSFGASVLNIGKSVRSRLVPKKGVRHQLSTPWCVDGFPAGLAAEPDAMFCISNVSKDPTMNLPFYYGKTRYRTQNPLQYTSKFLNNQATRPC